MNYLKRKDNFIGHFRMSYLETSFIEQTFLLQPVNIWTLMDTISSCGTRTGNMFLFGGTIGWSKYPQFSMENVTKYYQDQLPNPKRMVWVIH